METFDEIKNHLVQWERKLAAQQSRRDTILELMNDYEGYNKGVRSIIEANRRKKLTGICGVFADLFNVPQQYEAAIESVLGSALEYVIVDTEESARKAVSFLKQFKLGQVSLLPLDRISEKRISSNDRLRVSQLKGYVGLATELVTFEQCNEVVINHVLGDVIIFENIVTAGKVPKKLMQQYRIATIEGDLIKPDGILLGGSQPIQSTEILRNKRWLSEVKKEILISEQKISELKIKLQDR